VWHTSADRNVQTHAASRRIESPRLALGEWGNPPRSPEYRPESQTKDTALARNHFATVNGTNPSENSNCHHPWRRRTRSTGSGFSHFYDTQSCNRSTSYVGAGPRRSGIGTHRLCGPICNHFRCWSLTGGVAPVGCRSFSVGRNPPRGGAAAMGANRNTDLAD